jgi:hypothetical protein
MAPGGSLTTTQPIQLSAPVAMIPIIDSLPRSGPPKCDPDICGAHCGQHTECYVGFIHLAPFLTGFQSGVAELFVTRRRRYEFIPGMKRPGRRSRWNRIVIRIPGDRPTELNVGLRGRPACDLIARCSSRSRRSATPIAIANNKYVPASTRAQKSGMVNISAAQEYAALQFLIQS